MLLAHRIRLEPTPQQCDYFAHAPPRRACATVRKPGENMDPPQVASRSLTWTNEGQRSQGWLIGPRQLEAGKKHPMIVLGRGFYV